MGTNYIGTDKGSRVVQSSRNHGRRPEEFGLAALAKSTITAAAAAATGTNTTTWHTVCDGYGRGGRS